VQGLIILAVVDATVLAASLSSPYLSRQNLAFGNAAIVIMQTELMVTWAALQEAVHTGLGYAFIAWALLTALLVGWKLWRVPAGPAPWNKPMLCGLAFASLLTFAFGIWFWIFGSGGVYQIRYFVPFALMAMILAVPVMVRLIPAMHRWEVIVLSVPMALSVVNMGMLLAQSDPSIEWQKWAGVNLSSGGQDAVAVQAQNFLGTIKREGHDTILYSMPMSATDSKFQAVIDYSRTVGPSTPIVSIRRPVDWQRPTTYRINEMLGAEYWLFEPVRDPRVAKATLATRSIEGFFQERVLFQAWATQLTASDGVAVVSETPTARVLRIIGQTPVTVGAQALRVTASIGYARFPLPPYGAQVPWEQAVNLADMALYTAKNQGRNRAVGITSSTAATREALHDIESDFDRAWHDGRVTLLQTPGPELRESLHAA